MDEDQSQSLTSRLLALGTAWSRSRDLSDAERLWVKTKHLLLAILPAVQYSEKQTLIGALNKATRFRRSSLLLLSTVLNLVRLSLYSVELL